ncbi:MAG: metal-dependent transcriptional regulator [Clostridia bacterium]|nr:metal-dependent transcriptional regulator [Clostridia bacterium]
MQLQESGQMYLETILVLSRRLPAVRSIDIVEHMGYSKPSVSRAMSLLKSGGFIRMDEDGYITLTKDGQQVAETIFERHTVLTRALILLGVDPDTAAEDACKMEHAISDQSVTAIKKYLDSLV